MLQLRPVTFECSWFAFKHEMLHVRLADLQSEAFSAAAVLSALDGSFTLK